MKKIGFLMIVWLMVLGCTSQNGIVGDQAKVKVKEVTVQEMVSGIEGGKSVFEFIMKIEINSDKIQPDSLTHHLHKAKIHVKDAARNIYKAQYTESAEKMDLKNVSNNVIISFKGTDKPLVIEVDSVRVLDQIYMP